MEQYNFSKGGLRVFFWLDSQNPDFRNFICFKDSQGKDRWSSKELSNKLGVSPNQLGHHLLQNSKRVQTKIDRERNQSVMVRQAIDEIQGNIFPKKGSEFSLDFLNRKVDSFRISTQLKKEEFISDFLKKLSEETPFVQRELMVEVANKRITPKARHNLRKITNSIRSEKGVTKITFNYCFKKKVDSILSERRS